MQVPFRLVAVLRPSVHGAVLAAVGVATVVFSASPFLIDEVADHYELGLSSAALISTAQLGGFGIASFGAGRTLAGRRHVFVIAALALVLANVLSALVPPLPVLVGLRVVAGLAMGVTSWMAWSMVFGHEGETSEVSMVGPMVGIVAAPV
ncbi:MAG: MFS transporter, partial [Acidimicrobiia bacterium]|nr:MFS transporter [Acidimicrobiia bacterium]